MGRFLAQVPTRVIETGISGCSALNFANFTWVTQISANALSNFYGKEYFLLIGRAFLLQGSPLTSKGGPKSLSIERNSNSNTR